ncbi:MAG: ABC transporter ATP-binding protein [Bacillota bacterium]|nr:ABC transporter ATP-binding protein [Bacillota bacterium]MDW7682563.1 ABC transporter ATP-binding protein [Bacillota bacterium]
MTKPLVEAKNIYAGYSVGTGNFLRAVAGVSLSVDRAQAVGLVGESGSGKTTLGKVIAGLISPVAGRLLIGGGQAEGRPRPDIQMVFQDSTAALNPRMTVGALVGEGLMINKTDSKEARRQIVAETLAAVGLPLTVLNRYPHQFSGGQRQRIALARALIMRPNLVVLDEPVSALDVTAGAQILQMLMRLKTEYGLSYLLISHNLAVVRQICDRVAVMYLGKIVENGPVQNVFAAPGHKYTKMLLQSHLLPDPTKKQEFTDCGEPADPYHPPQGCRFHPRCESAVGYCARVPPGFVTIRPGHRAACHLPGRGNQ